VLPGLAPSADRRTIKGPDIGGTVIVPDGHFGFRKRRMVQRRGILSPAAPFAWLKAKT
jgi:hypothetical protein